MSRVHLKDDSVRNKQSRKGSCMRQLVTAVCGLTFLVPDKKNEITFDVDNTTCKRCKAKMKKEKK
jgi:hypothetical protein